MHLTCSKSPNLTCFSLHFCCVPFSCGPNSLKTTCERLVCEGGKKVGMRSLTEFMKMLAMVKHDLYLVRRNGFYKDRSRCDQGPAVDCEE